MVWYIFWFEGVNWSQSKMARKELKTIVFCNKTLKIFYLSRTCSIHILLEVCLCNLLKNNWYRIGSNSIHRPMSSSVNCLLDGSESSLSVEWCFKSINCSLMLFENDRNHKLFRCLNIKLNLPYCKNRVVNSKKSLDFISASERLFHNLVTCFYKVEKN